jgi:hypothetical protein
MHVVVDFLNEAGFTDVGTVSVRWLENVTFGRAATLIAHLSKIRRRARLPRNLRLEHYAETAASRLSEALQRIS